MKLVSEPGVGTIAAGVAKAYADLITISGYDGGTAASPLTSIRYAGSPFELGLAEVQQTLRGNGLRGFIRLQADGGLKTGLDVIKAAIMGAESFGFGTAPMVALGCKYLRICHLNNCATGVATQNRWLTRGLDAESKSQRCAAYVTTLRRDLTRVAVASGYAHPALVPLERFELLSDPYGAIPAPTAFGYRVEWGLPSWEDRSLLGAIMDASAPQSGASESAGNPR